MHVHVYIIFLDSFLSKMPIYQAASKGPGRLSVSVSVTWSLVTASLHPQLEAASGIFSLYAIVCCGGATGEASRASGEILDHKERHC